MERWVSVGLMGGEMGGCWVNGWRDRWVLGQWMERWVGVGLMDGEMGGCWVDGWRDG